MPRNVGSHSTDGQSRDQRVKRKVVYVDCKGGNVHGYKINIKVCGKIGGAASETHHTPTQI